MLIECLNESSLKILFSKIKTSSEAEDIKTLIESIKNKIVRKRLLELINEFEDASHDERKTPALSQIHIGPIATPGYFNLGQNFSMVKSITSKSSFRRKPEFDSISKETALQKILINHFNVDPSKIIVLTEKIKQRHLRYQYSAFLVNINNQKLLIVLNNQYGQATRLKRIKPIDDVDMQIEYVVNQLEGTDKKTMDEQQGFYSFANVYSSIEELEELYKQKINTFILLEDYVLPEGGDSTVHILQENITEIFSQSVAKSKRVKFLNLKAIDILNKLLKREFPSNLTIRSSDENIQAAMNDLRSLILSRKLGEGIHTAYLKYLEESSGHNEYKLLQSAEEKWEFIEGENLILTNQEIKIDSILKFLFLPASNIKKGVVKSTPIRYLINSMLNLSEDKKIKRDPDSPGRRVINNLNIQSAMENLKEMVKDGLLGQKAKYEFQEYLHKLESESLPDDTREIWSFIQGKFLKNHPCKDYRINKIENFLFLSTRRVCSGSINNFPVYEIVNKILNLSEGEELKRRSSTDKFNAAMASLRRMVLDGGMGEIAQAKFIEYLKRNPKKEEVHIDLNKDTLGIYLDMMEKKEKLEGEKIMITSIISLLHLSVTSVITKKFGTTPIRDIINSMLNLTLETKIKSDCNKPEERTINKMNVLSAMASLRKMVLDGEMGEELQKEYLEYLEQNPKKEEEHLDLSGSFTEVLPRLIGQIVEYKNRGIHRILIKDVDSLNTLPIQAIKRGKVKSTLLRDILNKMLKLPKELRINTYSSSEKTRGLVSKFIEKAKSLN